MRIQFLLKPLMVLTLVALLPATMVQAVVIWNGPQPASTTYLASVDPVIDITGDTTFSGHNIVYADTASMTVNVTVASTLNNTAGGPSADASLHFVADAGQTITININDNLTASGITDLGVGEPFTLTFSGLGAINVIFADGTTWTLDDSASTIPGGLNAAGAHALVDLDTTPVATTPFLTFIRANQASNADVSFTVGNNSSFMFVGTPIISSNTKSTSVVFDPTNAVANTGSMFINLLGINDSFLVQGHEYEDGTLITATSINDITFNSSRLGMPELRIAKTGILATDSAGLKIVNANTTMPRFWANPWYETDLPGALTTPQAGFIIGLNGTLRIQDGTYIDYQIQSPNVNPGPLSIPAALSLGRTVPEIVKDRNPAALMVDGLTDPYAIEKGLGNASIVFEGTATAGAGLYFSSAVDRFGLVPDQTNGFVAPASQYRDISGYGSIVFDVEAPLSIISTQTTGTHNNAIELLSLAVGSTGGLVDIDSTGTTTFPLRTFATDVNGDYQQYGVGSFLINNRTILNNISLKHTDEIHEFYEKNFPHQSAASYIGGESWWLNPTNDGLGDLRPRPQLIFNNARLQMHTNGAFTGVDLFVNEIPVNGNDSNFTFYGNGRVIDQGTGRSLILGTTVGSTATDQNSIVSRDSHLDNMQEFASDATPQILRFLVDFNNDTIVEAVVDPAGNSLHTIYLGHASNISVGSNTDLLALVDTPRGFFPATTFALTTTPTDFIGGDFFTFETQGGSASQPEMSMTTGEGGIFVDRNGIFELGHAYRANFALMVSQSRNGILDLYPPASLWANRVGIAQSPITLGTNTVIIPATTTYNDYTFDWKYITKAYSATSYPYEVTVVPAAGLLPIVLQENLNFLPVVMGQVDQFQFKNSRLGDQAGLMVDGGNIRELVLLSGDEAATEATAFLAVTNNAIVGIGTAERNLDSDDAQIKLGVNGLTIAADGSATIMLNSDVIIDNQAHFLKGPNFVSGTDILYIYSVEPREIRVKNTGIIDFTSFNDVDDKIFIGGNISLVFEPGARLLVPTGTLGMTDNSIMKFIQYAPEVSGGVAVTNTDAFRVKLSGTGTIRFSEAAQMIIPRGAFVGIESAGLLTVSDTQGIEQGPITVMDASYITDIALRFTESAKLFIGSAEDHGGALQVGNTTDMDESAAVTFSLELDGDSRDTMVNLDSQSFFGFGVGIINKPEAGPETWSVGRLYNVESISMFIDKGVFKHQQTYSTDVADINNNKYASIFAIANDPAITYTVGLTAPSHILGGGNMVLITAPLGTAVTPQVRTTTGALVGLNQTVGIMGSDAILTDTSKTVITPVWPITAATAANFFAGMTVNDYALQMVTQATFARNYASYVTAGYVDGTTIVRTPNAVIAGTTGRSTDPSSSLELGVVGLMLDAAGRTPSFSSSQP